MKLVAFFLRPLRGYISAAIAVLVKCLVTR